jgi:UDP-2,3-diacylglucosamine pyrophosphatase LpxH
MVIVVASDQHLGYANSNAATFSSFLDDLAGRSDVEAFVILGDWVDMWRRDVSGLFLQFNDILEKVLLLNKRIKVYCVAGNHDFHLLKLTDPGYPLTFTKDLTLQGNGVTYVLKHGWEFDLDQREPIMELLCYNFSDESGVVRSDVWDNLTRLGGDVDSFKELIDKHLGKDQYIQHLMSPPNARFSGDYSDVEGRAISSVQPGKILVFGHTHRPFVNKEMNVANSGSWVSDEVVTNTYVELDGTEVRIMRQGVGDITQQVMRT